MLVQADAAQGRLNRRSVRDAARARATAVRDDCDHESVWRRPRVLDLLKFTKNNLDPPVSSKTYSSTESDLKPRPAFTDARLAATEKEWSMQQSTQDRARPRIGRALARVAATLLLAAVVSQPELAHASPYGGGIHDGFVGPHHAVNPTLSLSAPTNSPLQEQMREDYATGLMGAQRERLQQNPSGLGRQEQEIGRELNGYTPR